MQGKHLFALTVSAALLAGAGGVRAQDTTASGQPLPGHGDPYLQGAADAGRSRVQTRNRERERTRETRGADPGSRYGQGYESRHGGRGFGDTPGFPGGARSGSGRR